MKPLVISLLFFLLPIASALTISFESPDGVRVDEEFYVEINLDSQDMYDVKIFVHNSEDAKISRSEYISEILSEKWEDSWFYIKNSYPDETSYKIRVTEYSENSEICARVRKTGTETTNIQCRDIEILEEKKKSQDNEKQEKQTEEKIEQLSTKEQPTEELTENSLLIEEPQKIILNSVNKDTPKSQEILTTKTEKTRQAIIYSFVFICVIIIILLALRKL